MARANAERLALGARVAFHRATSSSRSRALAGAIDLVVSNPPYVTAEEWAQLEPEVRDHDPQTALVPPEGVRALYDRLVASAASAVRPGGFVLLEIGAGDEGRTARAMERAGLADVGERPDLRGIPRIVHGRRPAAGPALHW